MLPLKLVRSLVLGETVNMNNPCILTQDDHHPDNEDDHGEDNEDVHVSSHHHRRTRRSSCNSSKPSSAKFDKSKTPALLFLPTKEIITDTYRLATIARDMGMDLYPTPSLSHIIFSYPSKTQSPSSSSSSSSKPSSFPSSWSFSGSSSSWPFLDDAVPIPFPSFITASVYHLRCFVTLSKGFFKLVYLSSSYEANEASASNDSNWDCCSISLYSRLTGDRIDTMEDFSRVLAGKGWTFFKTKKNPLPDSSDRRVSGGNSMYLFRKVDSNRVRVARPNGVGASNAECRIRELRLPPLDFRNAPLRILQYILLMTDDIFCLA
ncbi:Peroxisome proliferator-activated receptor gamma coactivator 1-beta like [Quillaja saponaria]|uniref:Peroxisome proliferator-activated receptor gamma coactivator 1-beta like n=1 Tax=Quillaja saponaria TaxID=32244 RepID=A0AAD7P7Y4_QUISA|nr:Peroxisome proliferator-activated receptor gamma coactivator 1-beta like [Quillaja saponaria]